MQLTPKPENDFAEFIRLYYAECRSRIPQIAAIAGKWTFEDLIPGLSDFDTRFIVQDGTSIEDWCHMSSEVGRVHLDLCERFPHWARNLEHLPGINLTWTELTDPVTYYPEYPQWQFYHTEDKPALERARGYLAGRDWDVEDEYFHLKKFCLYYGRYDRAIDPPVNLAAFEGKYPLHSRFMHYFCPPLQSALSMLLRRPVAGKMEAVRLACEMFDDPVYGEMREAVERHYEVPALYREPDVTQLEDRLEAALLELARRLSGVISIVPDASRKTVSEWKAELANAPVDPFLRVFDAAKFSRLMKGRLWFYAHVPPHFDSTWCIENELRRLRANFFETPFRIFWEVTRGEKIDDPLDIVPDLCPDVISSSEVHYTSDFARLLTGTWRDGEQKALALSLVEVFDGFFSAQQKITLKMREHLRRDA